MHTPAAKKTQTESGLIRCRFKVEHQDTLLLKQHLYLIVRREKKKSCLAASHHIAHCTLMVSVYLWRSLLKVLKLDNNRYQEVVEEEGF